MAGTRRRPGWMGTYIEGPRAWLRERGDTPGSIKLILTLAGQLDRWMQNADVKFSQLDSAAVDSFLGALWARGVRRVPGPHGLRPLLDYLDSEGAWRSRRSPTRRSSSWRPPTGPGWWSTGAGCVDRAPV